MKKILREPLIHFLIIGAGIFFLYGLMEDPTESRSDRIVVAPGQIERLIAAHKKTWQRPPTIKELDGLIEGHIRDEIYYREALAMGLDKDDIVIRRRLRQKMEFITEDLAPRAEPDENELRAFLREHGDRFQKEPHFAFQHVYLGRDGRTDSEADARVLLTAMKGKDPLADTAAPGDPFLLSGDFDLLPRSEIAGLLGDTFAEGLQKIEPGRWSGPLKSEYGHHVVFIRRRVEGRMPELEEVREAVKREWLIVRQKELTDAVYRGLRERYAVEVRLPEGIAGDAARMAESK